MLAGEGRPRRGFTQRAVARHGTARASLVHLLSGWRIGPPASGALGVRGSRRAGSCTVNPRASWEGTAICRRPVIGKLIDRAVGLW